MNREAAFTLDPRLAADCRLVGDAPLSRVLLMDDARFPWLILVPRRPGLRELLELARDEQIALLDEISRVGHILHALHKPDKLNIAMLGNVVPQLHVHVIARFTTDPAWPRPVWGVGRREPYTAPAGAARQRALRAALHLAEPAPA
jgi:diadenosine tetraphosphate (Ap4A) HIT family hydrolase